MLSGTMVAMAGRAVRRFPGDTIIVRVGLEALRLIAELEEHKAQLLLEALPSTELIRLGSGADRWSVDTWLVRTVFFFSFFFFKGLISEMVSCGAWARAGPIRAHMGPYRPIWAHMDPYGPHMGPYGPKRALYEPTICGPTM